MGIVDWGLGIGDWGLGIGDWGMRIVSTFVCLGFTVKCLKIMNIAA